MTRDTKSLKQTRRPTLAAVSDPAVHNVKRSEKIDDVAVVEIDKEVKYMLFDTPTANSSTEEKGVVDDVNLLECQCY